MSDQNSEHTSGEVTFFRCIERIPVDFISTMVLVLQMEGGKLIPLLNLLIRS